MELFNASRSRPNDAPNVAPVNPIDEANQSIQFNQLNQSTSENLPTETQCSSTATAQWLLTNVKF